MATHPSAIEAATRIPATGDAHPPSRFPVLSAMWEGTKSAYWWLHARAFYDRQRRERLMEAVQLHDVRLRAREEERARAKQAALPGEVEARALVEAARTAMSRTRYSEAWSALMEAERALARTLDGPELRARLVSVVNEAKEKLPRWRGKAASELDRQVKAAILPDTQWALLRELMMHLNAHASNQYFKIESLHVKLAYLGFTVVFALAAILYVVVLQPDVFGPEFGDQVRTVLLFGILGGALSAAMTVLRADARRKIPDQLLSTNVTLMRPILGGAAAVVVLLLYRGGDVSIGGSPDAALPIVAFLAGFSERWFLRAVAQRTGDEPEPRPPGAPAGQP